MDPIRRMRHSLIRLAFATILGVAVAVTTPLMASAKEKISKRALKEMVAGARTPADHKTIADYCHAEAAQARAKAKEHHQMSAWYQRAGEGVKKTPYAPGTIDHCERLVKNYRATAEDLTALAKEHELLAAKTK